MVISTSVVSVVSTVTAASAVFTGTLTDGKCYRVVSSTACWIKFGTAPTAVAQAAGNHYVPPNWEVCVWATGVGQRIAIIRDAADGNASLTEVSM